MEKKPTMSTFVSLPAGRLPTAKHQSGKVSTLQSSHQNPDIRRAERLFESHMEPKPRTRAGRCGAAVQTARRKQLLSDSMERLRGSGSDSAGSRSHPLVLLRSFQTGALPDT